jgi:hypothetical protein
MKRSVYAALFAALLVAAAFPLAAQSATNPVELGVSIGPTFPVGSGATIVNDGASSFNWGFYVNIPLVYALDLMPSAELYKFGATQATDIDLAFKFIVPLGEFSVYAGFVPGLTAVSETLAPHVGALLGGSYHIVSNLSGFLQGKYNVLFDGDRNIRVIHLNAGILLAF